MYAGGIAGSFFGLYGIRETARDAAHHRRGQMGETVLFVVKRTFVFFGMAV
jgi:hypothetical protein